MWGYTVEVPAFKYGWAYNDWHGLWTDTGINVTAGRTVGIEAVGSWTWDGATYVGAQGAYDLNMPPSWVNNHMRAQLIGYVGDLASLQYPPTSCIGIGAGTFSPAATGRLWLAMNDDYPLDPQHYDPSDNYGSVFVQVNLNGVSDSCPSRPTLYNGILIGGSSFEFDCWGPPQSTWNVYYSDDLNSWRSLSSTPSVTFPIDPEGNGHVIDNTLTVSITNRFYKLKSLDGSCCSQPYGFMEQTVPAGQSRLIANQLWKYPNLASSLLTTMPDLNHQQLASPTVVSKWNGSAFQSYTYNQGLWTPDISGVTLAPGEGVYLQNNAAADEVVSFVGWVKETVQSIPLPLSVVIPSGESMLSAIVPQSGGVTSTLKLYPSDSDTIYLWNGSGYDIYTYFFGAWQPSEPQIKRGQAFFFNGAGQTWTNMANFYN